MKTILLIALLSTQYKGDNDNVLGIRIALEKQYKNETLQVETLDLQIDNLNPNQIKIDKKQVIVIGAGLDGIKAFNILKLEKGNSKFIWSGHQLIKEVSENLKELDNVILPSYALNKEQIKQIQEAGVKLIETTGIPHTLTKEDCVKEYENLAVKKLIPDAPNGYIFTCLSGDAPDSNGEIKLYTKEEAYDLGEQLAQIAKSKNMVLLVTNGPRTGKYDPEFISDKKEFSVHKENSDIDLVSKAFLTGVENILGKDELKTKVEFENFVFGKPSVFKGYLGAAIENEKSIVVIGGESSSQITQALDLAPGRLYIKQNNAMNGIHKKQVDKIINTNSGAKLLNDENDLTINIITDKAPNDAELVAEEFEEDNHFFKEEACLYKDKPNYEDLVEFIGDENITVGI